MWNGLPLIRKEIAESMMTNFGLNQKEAAEKLGITPAAVCQYVSHKRGNKTIDDEELIKEIHLSQNASSTTPMKCHDRRNLPHLQDFHGKRTLSFRMRLLPT